MLLILAVPQQFIKKTGLVIRMFDAREADRVVHILTDSGARDSVVAKGIRRLKSRKAYAIDLLNLVTYKSIDGKQLDILGDVNLIDSHPQWKDAYATLIALQSIAEITSICTQEIDDEPAYFLNANNLLQVPQITKPLLLVAAYLLRCLYVHGSLPKLNEDVATGQPIDPVSPRFLHPSGGYTIQDTGVDPVPDRIYKSQKFILQHDFRAIQQLDLSEEEISLLFHIHNLWFEATLETQLKSANMLRKATSV